MNLVNRVGRRYGKLMVVERAPNYRGRTAWKCDCDCGGKTVVSSNQLHSGNTQSCGCLLEEWRRQDKYNYPPGVSAFNSLYQSYKKRAEDKGLIFDLTKKEFGNLTKSKCFYCDIEPRQISKGRNKNGSYIYNGIDRLDNSLGYTKLNSVPCCKHCNTMKMQLSYDEFMTHIEIILKKHRRID